MSAVVTQQAVPRKEEIIVALDHAQEAFDQFIRTLTSEDLTRSLGPDQWTVRQCVAHIARGEIVHVRLARLARYGLSLRFPNWMVPFIVRTFNAIQQRLIARKSVETLLADQRTGRAAVKAFIQGCSERDLAKPCFQMHNLQWAPLGEFLIHIAEHQEHHLHDIQAALAAQRSR